MVLDHVGLLDFTGLSRKMKSLLTELDRTLDVHLELEEKIAKFIGTEAAILYSQGIFLLLSLLFLCSFIAPFNHEAPFSEYFYL